MGKQKKRIKSLEKNNGNLECWRAMWKKPKVKKQKFEDMQDKGRWSGKILERSRRTISRMLCKRHRKSFYCRHRQQLWGNKKKKFTSVTLSHSNLYIMFLSFPWSFLMWTQTVDRSSDTYCMKERFKNQSYLFQKVLLKLSDVWSLKMSEDGCGATHDGTSSDDKVRWNVLTEEVKSTHQEIDTFQKQAQYSRLIRAFLLEL